MRTVENRDGSDGLVENHPVGRIGEWTPQSSDFNERQAFACGHESLDRWLATQAGQSMKSRDAVTYLLLDEQAIAGYSCLSAGSVGREEARPSIAKRAPDLVPVIRMGRFAIHRGYQGQGWGRDLLGEAIRSAAAALDAIGARAILVDAIDESARTFYLKNGFIVDGARKLNSFGGEK